MQIVIDIPEDVYKRTVFYREFRDLSDCVATIKALEKATPLPKGHGRLIDADALEPDTEWDNYYDGFISFSPAQIENAQTIIGADTAESEKISERNMKMWQEIFKAESEVNNE